MIATVFFLRLDIILIYAAFIYFSTNCQVQHPKSEPNSQDNQVNQAYKANENFFELNFTFAKIANYSCDDHISISSVFCPFKLTSFHVSFLSRIKMKSINWSAPNIQVFIAQLVEHCSPNAEAVGSNPVEALKNFFRAKICICLNSDYSWDDHGSISFVFCQFKLTSFHVSFLSRTKISLISWSTPNIQVFIAQLVEHCSANAERAMGSNPVEALKIFLRAKICNCLNYDYSCDDHDSRFHQYSASSN